MTAGTRTRHSEGGFDLFALLPWLALAVSLSLALLALFNMKLDMDEVEFFRATRFVLQGKVPYVGFWEHHTPLQWYLMAPVMALFARAPSTASFLAMRAAQAFFWGGSAVIAALWLRRRRVPGALAVLVLALLFANPAFSIKLVEYRIDAPMNFFYLLGAYFLERGLDGGVRDHAGRWNYPVAGIALTLSCLASQRMVLPVVATAVLYLFVRGGEKWGFDRRALWTLWTGAAGALATCLFFAAHGAFGAFWEQNVRLNAAYEGLPKDLPFHPFWYWFLAAPAERLHLYGTYLFWATALAGLVLLLRKVAAPGPGTRVLILATLQVIFLSSISTPLPYQFQTLWWLLALLAALGLKEIWPAGPVARKAVIAAASVAIVIVTAATVPRLDWAGEHRFQAHQDTVLRRIDAVTAPRDTVWDGAGYGVDRAPAFTYWFTPSLVRVLTENGVLPAFSEADLFRERPAAVVMDGRFARYCDILAPATQDLIRREYLPLEFDLWLPAPNARLTPGRPTHAWRILKTGRYRAAASEALTGNPWFDKNTDYLALYADLLHRNVMMSTRGRVSPAAKSLVFEVDGRPVKPSPGMTLDLKAGQVLAVSAQLDAPLAVLVVPEAHPDWVFPASR